MPINLPAEIAAKPQDWTVQNAEDAIAGAAAPTPTVKTARDQNAKFLAGDHWQGRNGWVGPIALATDPRAAIIASETERFFTSRNAIKEVVGRRKNGTVGTAPGWAFVPRRAMKQTDKPTNEEQADIDAIEALLTPWWDARKLGKFIQDFVVGVLTEERKVVRAYVPRGLLVQGVNGEGGAPTFTVPDGKIEDQLQRIFLDSPAGTAAAVVTNEATMAQVGVLTYSVKANENEKVLELVYVEGDKTVLRYEKGDTKLRVELNIGKRLNMYEAAHDVFITPQMREAQRALNLALTTIPKGITDAAWLEQIMLNANPPGDFKYDAAGNAIPGTYAPGEYVRGPNQIQWVRGLVTKDKEGNDVLQSPSVYTREPSGVDNSITAKKEHYQDVLGEAGQEHVLLTGEALPSGKSREQARADYRATLQETAHVVEPTAQWILETVLALAEHFAGSPGKYSSKYRAVVSCRLDLGPLSLEERTADKTSVDSQLLARESAMERAGIGDVDAENARIAADPGASLARKKTQGEALAELTGAGATLEGAAAFIGMTPAEIKQLTGGEGGVGDTGEPPVDDSEDNPPVPIPPSDVVPAAA